MTSPYYLSLALLPAPVLPAPPCCVTHGFYFSLSNLFQTSFLLLHPLNPGFYLEKRLLRIDQKMKKEQIISLLLFFKRVPKLLHF